MTLLKGWMLLPAALLLVSVSVPVSAQAANPTMTISVEGLPAEADPFQTNGTAEYTFTVSVTADNMICLQNGAFTVSLAAAAPDAPSYVTTNLSTDTLEFTVSQGPHSSNGGRAWSGSQDAQVSVLVGNVTENATAPLTVTAAFPGGQIENCQSNGAFPAVEDSASTNASFVRTWFPQPPPPPVEEESFLPGPGAVLGTLAAFAAAGLRRRDA